MNTSELVKINKDFFINASSVAAKTAIFGALPYLNTPPFNFLINKFVDWLVIKIAEKLEVAAFFTFIDFRVDRQGAEYVIASRQAYKTQTEEDKRIADEKFAAFFKLNNY